MTDRTKLEYDIIGSCIMENAFGSVVHILRAKHFSQPECAVLWQQMSNLWPNHHISLHKLSRVLADKPKVEGFSWQKHLAFITAVASGSTQLVSNALLLLELFFTEHYTSLLHSYRLKEQDLAKKTILDEALAELKQPDMDIFIELDLHKRFFKANNLTELANDIDEMAEHINARAQQIRLIDRREILQRELTKLDQEEAELNQIMNQKTQHAA